MERIRFTLSDDLVQLLDEKARLEGKSRSASMRAAVLEALEREEREVKARIEITPVR